MAGFVAASSEGGFTSSFDPTFTVAYTPVAGSGDEQVIVCTATDDSFATVSSMTIDGNTMTQVGSNTGSGWVIQWWQGAAPSTGSDVDIVITWTDSGGTDCHYSIFTVDGAQTDAGENHSGSTGDTSSPYSVSITSATDDLVVAACLTTDAGQVHALTVDSGSEIYNLGTGPVAFATSHRAGATSTAMDFSDSETPVDDQRMSGFSIPASGGGGGDVSLPPIPRLRPHMFIPTI